MRKLFVLFVLAALPAAAQNNRSFVATYGNDANNCTAGNECRTFARALSVTNPGGEVLALTSGGYGAFTVTQPVSVIATTGDASITVSGSNGVTVAAGSADHVVLKGLNVSVLDTSSTGIEATGFGALSIDDCATSGGAVGVYIGGSTTARAAIAGSTARASAGPGFLLVSPVTLTGCRAEGNAGAGVSVSMSEVAEGVVAATGLVSSGNGTGFSLTAPVLGSVVYGFIDHSQFANNTGDGIALDQAPSAIAVLYVTNSSASSNGGYGFDAINGSFYTMKNNSVGGNTLGDRNGSTFQMSAF